MTTTHTAEFYWSALADHRWRIRARNGRIVADSGEGYRRRIDCKRAFHRVIAAGRNGTLAVKDV